MFSRKSLFDLCEFLDGCGHQAFCCEVLFLKDESIFSISPKFQLYRGRKGYHKRSGGVEGNLLYSDGIHRAVRYEVDFKRTFLFSLVGASAVALITPNEFSETRGSKKSGLRTIWDGEPVAGDYSPQPYCAEGREVEYKKRPLRLLFGSSYVAENVGLPPHTVLHAFDVQDFVVEGDRLQFCVYGSREDIGDFLKDSRHVTRHKGLSC